VHNLCDYVRSVEHNDDGNDDFDDDAEEDDGDQDDYDPSKLGL